jgi:cell division protein FtsL
VKNWVVLGFMIAGLLLLDIGQRIHMINLGYEIEQLLETHHNLQRVNKELLIEKGTLSSLDRIERIAKTRLGMKRPKQGRIIQVHVLQKNESPTADVSEPRVVKE